MKGSTFPPSILARLTDVVKDGEKGAYHNFPLCSLSIFPVHTNSTLQYALHEFARRELELKCYPGLLEPEVKPVAPSDPRAAATSHTPTSPAVVAQTPTPTPTIDPQAALLALLTQAVSAAGAPG